MSFRDSLARNISPIPIRLALALVFLWAGLGKMLATMPVQGQPAATLANLGHAGLRAQAGGAPDTTPAGSNSDDTTDDQDEPVSLGVIGGPIDHQVSHVADNPTTYYAADFPDNTNITRVYGLVLAMNAGAAEDDDFAYWPRWAAQGELVFVLAWLVAISELLLGLTVLLGLLTRLSALGLASIMLAAMWLTQVGPAMQSGHTTLGFLPGHSPWDMAWMDFMFQLVILAAALALFFQGAGRLSFDHLMFAPKNPEPPEEEEEDEDYEE